MVASFLGHSQILSCSHGDKIWEWLGTEASVVVFEAQEILTRVHLVFISDLVDSDSADLCLYCHHLATSHFQHLDISKHRTTLKRTVVERHAGCHDDETVLFQPEELSQDQGEDRLVKRCCFCGQKIEPLSRGKPGSEKLRVTEKGHGMEVLRRGCVWGEARSELEVRLVRGWESGSEEGGDDGGGKQVGVQLLFH